MNVLHCFKVYLPEQMGGIEEAISWLSSGAPDDVRCSILVCRKFGLGSTISVNGVEVERTTCFGSVNSIPISPAFVLRLRQKMAEADVVVFHAPYPLMDMALSFGMRADQALVIHWHADIVGRDWLKPVFEPLLRRSIRRADRVLASTQALIDSSRLLSEAKVKCREVALGIDTGWWTQLDDADRAAVDELRRKHPRLVVGCGRLVPYKGFDVLLDAMTSIDAHLFIVGTGPREADLRAQCTRLGLDDKVTFTGFVERSRQRQILNAAGVFALSSTTEAEAFGISQLEAMCCGVPIVNTSVRSGVSHVARDGKEGRTVPPGDAPALAAAINRLLDDPELARRFGDAALRRAREEYHWTKFVAASHAQYREALAERRRQTAA